MKPVLCPVCKGEGELRNYTQLGTGNAFCYSSRECHGCDGKGWVEVREDPPADISCHGPVTTNIPDYLTTYYP